MIKLNDGLTVQSYVSPDFFINLNDTVQMELDAIDRPVYDYFYTLNQSTLNGQSAAPANPVSNFSNNALGYFCALLTYPEPPCSGRCQWFSPDRLI
jgi:hypothetical protein